LIALIVTFDGFPLGYEALAGNTHDSQTLQTILATMEARHGTLSRVWIADRGMGSKENLAWLRETGRRACALPNTSCRPSLPAPDTTKMWCRLFG
jgi:transposase